MKNWLYIPFLVLMAVTYTRVVDNYNTDDGFALKRGPASVWAEEVKPAPEISNEDCVDITARFNPHLKTKNCSL